MSDDLEISHIEDDYSKELWICPSENGAWMSLSGETRYGEHKEEEIELWLTEEECKEIASFFSKWL